MDSSNEDRFTPRNKMDEESSKMVFKLQHWNQSIQSSGKTNKKRWEDDDINQFLKPEETEKTKGNDFD